jgi:hypothetical protein
MNVPGIASEMVLHIEKWIGPLQRALNDTKVLGTALDGNLAKASGNASSSLGKTASSADQLARAVDVATKEVRELSNAEKSIGTTGFISFKNAVISIGATIGVIAAVKTAMDFGATGIKLAADMEQTRIAFETIIGDAGAAKKTLDELKVFAAQTPFRFDELANASRQLIAMGVSARDAVPALKRIGDVASGLNQPVGEVAYLFGQIKSQGRAMTQDLNQFASRGIPIYRELAAVLKTNELGVRDLAEQGQIGFDDINAAFERMTTAGGAFFGMTERQSKSLNGQLSTLADSWDAVARAMGEAFVGNKDVNDGIGSLIKAVDGLIPAAERFGESLRSAIESAMPMIKTLVEQISAGMDMLSGGNSKRIIEGSAQPAVGLGLEKLKPEDVGVLMQSVEALGDARAQLAAGLNKLGKFDSGQSGILMNGKEVSKDVALRVQESMKAASDEFAQDKVVEQIREVYGRITRGESVSTEEWNKAIESASKLSIEVDGFRQNITALKTELIEKSELFEKNPIRARVIVGVTGPGQINEALAQATATLDATRPLVGKVRSELGPVSNQAAQAEIESKDLQERLKALDATGRAQFDKLKGGDLDPKVADDLKKQAEKIPADRGKSADRDRDENDKKARESAEQQAEWEYVAQRATLELQGKAFEAKMLDLKRLWTDRINIAMTDEAKLTAKVAYEAEQRLLIAKESDRRMKGIGGESFGPVTLDQLKDRARNERDPSKRTLAQLDLRESLGNILSEADKARQDRLRERTGISLLPELPSNAGRGPVDLFPKGIGSRVNEQVQRYEQSQRGGVTKDSAVNVNVDTNAESLATLIAKKAEPALQKFAELAANSAVAKIEQGLRIQMYNRQVRGGI